MSFYPRTSFDLQPLQIEMSEEMKNLLADARQSLEGLKASLEFFENPNQLVQIPALSIMAKEVTDNAISLILISKIDSVMRDKGPYKKFSKVEMYKTLKKQKIYESADGSNVLGEFSKNQKTIFFSI